MVHYKSTTYGAFFGMALGHVAFHYFFESEMHFMRILLIAIGGILGATVVYVVKSNVDV